ncbi:PBECR4 domain-containing protein [Veillonella magna]|uniref:Phage-Barnase-EndoU-ColicinE5/D-RelE like nuclease 4 domain-containing protein n=1 Tax=Veillonella magna TaxID=464322 RepID=A0ABS2GDH3_9FIRM|nr:PBECR4 domain-containing protein [Veillonella magna]MBM6823528.1 hypothetical protein [Veillonella magna]MBM6911872.1 hypothetical protein [Veillonella magna]
MDYIDKRKALEILFTSAENYQNNLNERNLLFVHINKRKQVGFIETKFSASNFQHLTGVVTDKNIISPSRFYELCLNKKLKISEFEFRKDGTTELKLRAMPEIFSKNISGKMLGDFDAFKVKLQTEKLVGGIRAAIGFVKEQGLNQNIKKDKIVYVPNTLLTADIRDLVTNTVQIIETYSKRTRNEYYTEQVYRTNSKTVDWGKVKQNEIYKNLPIIRKPIEKGELIKTQSKRPKIIFHRPESKSNGHER